MKRGRGGVLVEAIFALAIFVGAALTILSSMSQAVAAFKRARDAEQAADLARSALAMLEAGLATPETLSGPIDPARVAHGLAAEHDELGTEAGFDAPEWELIVDTEGGGGLTLVTVTARRLGARSDVVEASYTVRQFVPLGPREADMAGEPDALETAGGSR